MTKYYLESAPLSYSETIEMKSEKCKCGKKSDGVFKKPDVEHVVCEECLPSFVTDYQLFDWEYIPWLYVIGIKVRMKMKTFDYNCHL